MSGECEKCGEHCVDCQCDEINPYETKKDMGYLKSEIRTLYLRIYKCDKPYEYEYLNFQLLQKLSLYFIKSWKSDEVLYKEMKKYQSKVSDEE